MAIKLSRKKEEKTEETAKKQQRGQNTSKLDETHRQSEIQSAFRSAVKPLR
ncbi:MAG: hypothetical protein JKY67_15855 [Pseudomonadales bacterium]|nr:hypothetical protein [Pseudomonadales bacterium]